MNMINSNANSLIVACMVLASLVVGPVAGKERDRSPMTNNNLPTHVSKWSSAPYETEQLYGHIKTWDTSQVTKMRNLFAYMDEFNEDISDWDVSQVTDFSSMFWDALKFNQDLTRWNTSRAENMACMFCGAEEFNGDITNWDVSRVSDMFSMFDGAFAFSQDLSKWDVRHVDNMREMFKDATSMKGKMCFDSGVNETGKFLNMFEGTKACFNKKCVSSEVFELSGCSGAASMQFLGGVGLMLIVSMLTWWGM